MGDVDVTETTEKRSTPWVRAAAALMTVAVLGAGCSSQMPSAANQVAWSTETVSLTASNFWIVADGESYLANPNAVDVHSDPGGSTYTTLELIWTEHDREMRFFTYFQANGSTWSSNEMRTYNGQSSADWLFYDGTFFQSPYGTSFRGDIDLTNDATDSIRGELHLDGVVLTTPWSAPQ